MVDNPKDDDPAAVMALMAAYQPKAGGDTRRKPAEAFALVVELSTGGNPLEVAKEHVTARIQKDFAGTTVDVKLEPLATSSAGVALPTGGPAIGRFRFRSPLDKDDRSLWIISAVSVGGKVVAIEIDTEQGDVCGRMHGPPRRVAEGAMSSRSGRGRRQGRDSGIFDRIGPRLSLRLLSDRPRPTIAGSEASHAHPLRPPHRPSCHRAADVSGPITLGPGAPCRPIIFLGRGPR